jgi:P27 family predicted phage terminase small subunit
MQGRHAHPLNVLIADGKKHLTNAEKEKRSKTEVKMIDGPIKCPCYVRRNTDAYRKWRETLAILKGAQVIKPGDAGALARYCMAWSEYLDLLKLREEVANVEPFGSEEEQIIESFEEEKGKKAAAMMWKKIEFIFSAQAVLSFDKGINQKMSVILSLEDRLGLNIVARSKISVPIKEEPEKSDDEMMFGG